MSVTRSRSTMLLAGFCLCAYGCGQTTPATHGETLAGGGGVAAGGSSGTSGGSSDGSCVPRACPPTAPGCDVYGCCHKPCVDGETCGAIWHAGGPTAEVCTCQGGKLSCCVNTPTVTDCHRDQTCAATASPLECVACCAAGERSLDFAKPIAAAQACFCDPGKCGIACADLCASPWQSSVTDACVACLAGVLSTCLKGIDGLCLGPCQHL